MITIDAFDIHEWHNSWLEKICNDKSKSLYEFFADNINSKLSETRIAAIEECIDKVREYKTVRGDVNKTKLWKTLEELKKL